MYFLIKHNITDQKVCVEIPGFFDYQEDELVKELYQVFAEWLDEQFENSTVMLSADVELYEVVYLFYHTGDMSVGIYGESITVSFSYEPDSNELTDIANILTEFFDFKVNYERIEA